MQRSHSKWLGNEFDIFKLQLYAVKMSYFCALLARTFEMLQEVENLTTRSCKNMNLTTRRCKKLLHVVVKMLRACSQCYSYESLQCLLNLKIKLNALTMCARLWTWANKPWAYLCPLQKKPFYHVTNFIVCRLPGNLKTSSDNKAPKETIHVVNPN